jgi:hypothetical protein
LTHTTSAYLYPEGLLQAKNKGGGPEHDIRRKHENEGKVAAAENSEKSLVGKLLAGCQQGKTLSYTKAFHLLYNTALVF